MIYVTDSFNLSAFFDPIVSPYNSYFRVVVTSVSEKHVLNCLEDKEHNYYFDDENIYNIFYNDRMPGFSDVADEDVEDEIDFRAGDIIFLIQLVDGDLLFAKIEQYEKGTE